MFDASLERTTRGGQAPPCRSKACRRPLSFARECARKRARPSFALPLLESVPEDDVERYRTCVDPGPADRNGRIQRIDISHAGGDRQDAIAKAIAFDTERRD